MPQMHICMEYDTNLNPSLPLCQHPPLHHLAIVTICGQCYWSQSSFMSILFVFNSTVKFAAIVIFVGFDMKVSSEFATVKHCFAAI